MKTLSYNRRGQFPRYAGVVLSFDTAVAVEVVAAAAVAAEGLFFLTRACSLAPWLRPESRGILGRHHRLRRRRYANPAEAAAVVVDSIVAVSPHHHGQD